MIHRRYLLFTTLLFLAILVFRPAPAARAQSASGSDVTVQISQDSAAMVAGDWVAFTTLLRNDGAAPTPPLVAHLNIAAVKQGPYVDPEDWSSERTQYVQSLQPGGSVALKWQVHALVEGEFASFVTVVSPKATFEPAVSDAFLLHVEPDRILPLNVVLPIVAIVPVFPLAFLLWTIVRNRRSPLRPVASSP